MARTLDHLPDDQERLLAAILATEFPNRIKDAVRRARFDSIESLPDGSSAERGSFTSAVLAQHFRDALPDWVPNREDGRAAFLPPHPLNNHFERMMFWSGMSKNGGIKTNKKGKKTYVRIGQPQPVSPSVQGAFPFSDDTFLAPVATENMPAKRILAIFSSVKQQDGDVAPEYLLQTYLAVPTIIRGGTFFVCADIEQIDEIEIGRIPFMSEDISEDVVQIVPEIRELRRTGSI